MDKPTRLGRMEADIRHRIDIALLMERIRGLEDPGYAEYSANRQAELKLAGTRILEANGKAYFSDEEIDILQVLGDQTCLNKNGSEIPLLMPEELEAITVQRGTLTDRERDIMQQHVVHTVRMLKRMCLEGEYAAVPVWAGAHHEYLDGSGYPDHLTERF